MQERCQEYCSDPIFVGRPRVVLRGGLGGRLRRHEDRASVGATLHVPHPALRPWPRLPAADRVGLAAALAARAGARPSRRRGRAHARGAARRQPLRSVPRHVGGRGGAHHRLPADRHRRGRVGLDERAAASAPVDGRNPRPCGRRAGRLAQDRHPRSHGRQPRRNADRARRRNRCNALPAALQPPSRPQGGRGGRAAGSSRTSSWPGC